MSTGSGDDLRARMAKLLDKELVERASMRVASRAQEAKADSSSPETTGESSISDRLALDVFRIAAAALRMPEEQLEPQENLANLGVDSIAITEIMVQISRHFGISVAPTTFFEAKHIDDLSSILLERFGTPIAAHYAKHDAAQTPPPASQKTATPAADTTPVPAASAGDEDDQGGEEPWIRRQRAAAGAPAARLRRPAEPESTKDAADDAPIAIVSMEGMFPQSSDLETFEAHLKAGKDCIEEVPADRWDWRAVHGDPKKGPFTDVKYGGFVPEVDHFDASFFNISPREAELMDPQHRLFMECVWSLIEKGGYAPGSLAGRKISLFLGINLLDYTDMVNRAGIMDAQQLTGLGHAFCPNRLSFLLDIHGPSEVIDTACSSSLVAIHRAVMSIRHEGCEMAIAGGSNLMLSPTQHIMFSKVGMITPDGRCKTFSKDANGYARADGVGAVLLKRLDLAERDGDPILGVIRGSVEHHGGGATSLTAPNPKAQGRLIVEAHRQAGVDPRSIDLIECHGTGTPLGDPIEVEGLKLAFGELYRDWNLNRPDAAKIGLGSVKSNIGHAETAAGVAGLIKVLLAMKSGTLFRTLHCAEPNPLLDLAGSPFYLLQDEAGWKRPLIDGKEVPRRAGISSFGAGGANVHLVIEEYSEPERRSSQSGNGPFVVPVSAKTEPALLQALTRLLPAVRQNDLADIAYTLQVGRDAMRHRVAFVAADREDLVEKLEAFLAGNGSTAERGTVAAGRREKFQPLDPSGKDPAAIARHWVSGGEVKWPKLDTGACPRRIPLPGYAFQRKRYWLPDVDTGAEAPRVSLTPVATGAGVYQLSLTGNEFFLKDHKVAGSPVLPGVAYLELARAAAVQEGIANPALRQVVWMAPLVVEKPVPITCEFSGLGDGNLRAEIFSTTENGERLLHAQMRVAADVEATELSVDLNSLRGKPATRLGAGEVYAGFDAMGLVYGQGHRAITDLAVTQDASRGGEVLARLELPGSVEAGFADFGLHPSLLDGALQAAIGLALDASGKAPEAAALPFSVEGVKIFGACEKHMWAHVRQQAGAGSGLRKMDIDLIDEQGRVRLSLQGFTTRALDKTADSAPLRFRPRWRPLDAVVAPVHNGRGIVLLPKEAGNIEELAALLPDHDVRLLQDDPAASLDQRFLQLANQLLSIAQADLASGPCQMQMVLGTEENSSALAGLAAMLRSISREHSAFRGQVLVLTDRLSSADLAEQLKKAAGASAGSCLKTTGKDLSLEVWEEVSATPEPASLPWKSDGVYLVTGGTGGLGIKLAREIIKTVPGATVVLASRSQPKPEIADWIAETPALNHRIADFSDARSVENLVQHIREEYGRLDGVIHAAGVIRDEVVLRKTPEQLADVLAPKVTGAVALDRAIGDAPLDFLVFFSSISGIVGNVGQADYAAANSFLDGFAEARETRRKAGTCHGKTVSVAWPLWREGGMSLAPEQETLMRRTTGLVPLETRQGLDALYSVLGGVEPRLLIASGEGNRIRRFVGDAFEQRSADVAMQANPETPAESRPPVATGSLRRMILASLMEEAGAQLKVSEEDLEPDEELTEYGFDSIGFTQFANRLNDRFGLELTPTLFFEYPTLDGLADYLVGEEAAAMSAVFGAPAADSADRAGDEERAGARAGAVAPASEAVSAVTPSREPAFDMPEARPAANTDAGQVAIIGMSGQFPGAPDIDAFWDVLNEGRNTISEVPSERWDWRDYWGDPLSEPGKGNVKWGGFIEDLAAFDAAFFGISAPEARMMDPQQRLLLTQAWRVMEDAGYVPSALAGSDTGVFIGTADTGYSRLIADNGTKVEGYSMTGLAPSLGPNRISYFYDFHGPSVAVETACSSALIAVHRAAEAIRAGHCASAIAGGINTLLLPEAFVGFSKAGMLSPEGLCKPFSKRADGYARGEGVGLVFLKLLSEAEREGDRVLGVLRSSAENHGGHAASLTAPNPKAQADLIRTAYRRAGIDPRTVGYIEAHGTGTPLGDPIEIEALTAAFAGLASDAEAVFGPAPEQSCAIGSVKSNIGHLELAAGIAGLIKVLLQLRHGKIVRSLYSEDLNPYLKLQDSPFHIAQQAEDWPHVVDSDGNLLPRRAGVSSFGFGGTNAHVVLEEYLAPHHAPDIELRETPELIVLSAKTADQLKEMAEDLRAFVAGPANTASLADIAFTLQTAREQMDHRLGFVCRSMEDLRKRLEEYLAGETGKALHTGTVKSGRKTFSVLESDGPLREAAASLAARGRAEDLLVLWASGLSVDWAAVREGRPARRISLPGYPFARKPYWVGKAQTVSPATNLAAGSCTLRLDGSESYLRDHLVNGVRVVPGVLSFELVRLALDSAGRPASPFELAGHTWTGAVAVETGPEQLDVFLNEGPSEGFRYSIVATGARRHAEGVLRLLPGEDAPRIDLGEARQAADTEIDRHALYQRFEALGLGYGPSQKAITHLWHGAEGVVAQLDLPQEADRGFALHPSILDGALQAVLSLNDVGDGLELALPYSVRRVRIYGRTADRMWAVIRQEAKGTAIDLCDDDGVLVIRLEDLVTRPLPVAKSSGKAGPEAQPALDETERRKRTLVLVTGIAARVLEIEPEMLDPDTELGDFGFDSVSMTAFAAQINSDLSLNLTPADFFEFATLSRLAGHICDELTDAQLGSSGSTQPLEAAADTSGSAQGIFSDPAANLVARPSGAEDDPVVIVGQSCCFPGAADAEEFWSNLISGRDSISRIPADRWSWQQLDGDPRQDPSRTNIHWGGFIDRVFEFDPLFFGISPREARLMDPQQRLMMTHAWKAIEDAGHAPESLAGQKVGVFVGTSSSGYRDMIGADSGGEGYVATGSVPSVGPNRISFLLDLHGPSEPVETACSSSLVALHRAVQAIRAGDCDMALVGGVNTILTPEAHINFAKAGMLSADGRCKTFSSLANGYVRGEGVGMVFLRKLSDAERDGDPILAVVRSTAINHGGRANSLTAPNTQAQADLLTTAYSRAGIDPRSVGYIEAHGTGTALGDPVEINALKSAFASLPKGATRLEEAVCGLASVKTNIGHLELAAGVAGLIKVLKQIEHRQLAPSLHCEEVNPYIDLSGSPFEIVREARPWKPVKDESGAALPLRAGISSFGFGGVNAHVVVEEYLGGAEVAAAPSRLDAPVVVVLSARDRTRLNDVVRDFLCELESGRLGEADLGDLAYTLQIGRSGLGERLACVVSSLDDLRSQLTAVLAGSEPPDTFFGDAKGPDRPQDADAAGIARHWVRGGKVDWQKLNPGRRRRLRLPTYPFARDIYRVGGAEAETAAKTEPASTRPNGRQLNADAYYLKDHVVHGSHILPGAMSLDVVLTAALDDKAVDALPARFANVTWRRPIELNTGQLALDVHFSKGSQEGLQFRLSSAGTGEPDFMRGQIGGVSEAGQLGRLDINALQNACRTGHDPDWLYACYSALGIDYGPAFRAITELSSRKGEVLARLQLPKAAGGSDHILHPSLIDAAFHAALVAFSEDDSAGLALPFAIDRMDVTRPTSEAMWAHLRVCPASQGLRKLDIDLADDTGAVCVRITGFTLRLLEEPKGEQAPPAMMRSADTATADHVEDYFVGLVARETEIDPAAISLTAPLEDYGIDSVLIMQLTDSLERDFGPLSKTLFFDCQTLEALIGYFRANHGDRLAEVCGGGTHPAVAALPATAPATAKRGDAPADDPIAIIGLAGRYPGARSLEDFWKNLAAGRDCITEVPAERWDHRRFYDPVRQPGKTTGKWGGFVDGYDRFDPMFFNIAPREALYMDPQERLFLQCAWETLEDAGYTRAALAEQGDVGVFAGVMWEEYQLYGPDLSARGTPAALTGSAASIANRVSYFLNFHGPSIAVDTMCSSSLTAIHLACDSLRSGSCAVALAGGVNLTPHPNKFLALSQGRFLSSKGRCESFGEGGDGYVPAEGVGAILLKPLSRAEADGDRIYGVILGSALNHGGKTNGYTVPNPAAQTAVIEKALARAGVVPEDVSYVEAHGTGTSLGDPIEVTALTRAYGTRGACAIGSVKSNIGHAESAAGIAGLTKLLLQLKHAQLAPSIHSGRLNPNIDFEASPFRVQRSLAPWPSPFRAGDVQPRIAGLSSFGAGGANAHFIVAEHLEKEDAFTGEFPEIYPLSARDPERLTAVLTNFLSRLDSLTDDDLPSVAWTLQQGREAFEERLAIVARGKADLQSKLDDFLADKRTGVVEGDDIIRARVSGLVKPIDPAAPLREIAASWARGASVDWRVLWAGARARPISLPSYPFAEDRYWLPELAGDATAPAKPAAPAAPLPLLYSGIWQERTASADEGRPQGRVHQVVCDLASSMPQLAGDLGKVGAEVTVLAAPQTAVDDRYQFHALHLFRLCQDLACKRQQALLQVVVPLGGTDTILEGLAGLLRCAKLEHPGLSWQLVATDGSVHDLADRLSEDAKCAGNQSEIRYRRGRRFVRSWQELEVAQQVSQLPWKDSGVYLLTGGMGGIGQHVAKAIAASVNSPSLWLTGRSPMTPAIREGLSELEALGASVRYRSIDVTDELAVSGLLHEIEQDEGELDGVIHGAGLTRDGLLTGKTEETFREVLAPKTSGIRLLDEVIGDRPLDFMVLFASAAGALGNPGQSDYATANAFLDSFAAWRNSQVAGGTRHGRTVSIDWPYWREGGMHMDERTAVAMERASGVRPLETGPALAALTTILAQRNVDQVLVLDGDHERLRSLMTPTTPVDGKRESIAAARSAPAIVQSEKTEPVPDDREKVVAAIKASFSACLGIPQDRLAPDDTIDRFGVDSVSALEIVEALESHFGPLSQTILFEFQTINRLADELLERSGAPKPPALEQAGLTEPPLERPDPAAPTGAAPSVDAKDVAVIAVAGRYPGAETIEAFADILRAGSDCITEIPTDRQELLKHYSPRKGAPGSSHCKWGGFLSNIDSFDAEFFGYTPRAADLADPQERLFLETTWHLLERAGHTRSWLAEHYQKRVGVFVGAMYNQYPALASDEEDRALLALSSYAGIANRTSFFFDLQGPSVAVDSMCSSGLQAVHQACRSLRSGECGLAIAGGVNLSIHPAKYEALSRAGLVASTPDARPFAGGDGYLPAEGVGTVLLKPLGNALADGDRILGVIKESLANHAGHSAGYAVPNADAQARLLEDAFRNASIDPATIGYVETAATGASIGDNIELRALARVYADRDTPGPAIGSVKALMGHAEAASGLAQLTKVLLQLEHRELFPSFGKAAPLDTFEGTPFRPQRDLSPWKPDWNPTGETGSEEPMRAAISSFGAGGSNVHLILESAPVVEASGAASESLGPWLFPVSARTEEQLSELRRLLGRYLRDTKDVSLEALSRTLGHGRERLDCQAVFVAANADELIAKLEDGAYRGDERQMAAAVHEVSREGPFLVLPVYPFKRERHWLKGARAREEGAVVAAPVKDLPDYKDQDRDQDRPDEGAALQLICKTLGRELGCEAGDIDRNKDFEGLGVDSMARMRLIYAVEEACGVSLNQQEIEAHPTPALLSGYLETLASRPEPGSETVQAASSTGPYRLPLGEAQKGLWALQSLYAGRGDYNVPITFECRSLDIEALKKTVDWLVRSYPVLATHVVLEDEDPVLVERPEPLEIDFVTLPREIETGAILRQRASIPFHLGEGVFRVEHITGGSLQNEACVVLLVAHHIVTDGVSSEVITRAFWSAYEHFSGGGSKPVIGSGADYSEFVAWENAFSASGQGQAQKEYWLEKLSGTLPTLHLPRDPAAGQQAGGPGQSGELKLPATLGKALADRAKASGVSLASLCLTAFAALLYRYTGERDLVIGVPTLRRPSVRFAETVGYCANIVALRLALRPEFTGEDLSRQVHAELGEGLARSEFPFSSIARELGGTSTGEMPYQVTFAYQNFGQDLSGLECFHTGQARLVPDIRQAGDTPLGIEVQNGSNGVVVIANAGSGVFEPGAMDRLLQHYRLLLEGLVARSDRLISEMPMLTRAEVDRALHHWSRSRSQGTSGVPVHEQFLGQARKTPSAIAVTGDSGRLSYKQLAARFRRIGFFLERRGVKRGDRVAVLLGREPDGIAALLAVMSIGAVWVPLDPDHPDERLGSILKDAGSAAVLTKGLHADRLGKLGDPPAVIIDLAKERTGLQGRLARPPSAAVRAEDPTYIIYTSGSTGAPKGVAISHGALSGHCEVIAKEYALTAGDAVLQFAPTSVDTAIEQILPVLTKGGRLELRPDGLQAPADFLKMLRARAVTVADLPPVLLHELLRSWEQGKADLSGLPLRLLIVGGEALAPEVVDLWSRSALAGCRLINAYGPTEATITALTHSVKPNSRDHSVPIGRPLPGMEVYILDRDGNLVPDGVVGELHLGGERLAIGYHERPELTEAKFRDHRIADRLVRLYATGDLARFRANSGGLVEFHGRLDDQVKIRGYRIELGEVEAAIASCGISEVAVVLERSLAGDPVLTAYLGAKEKSFDELEVKRRVSETLPAHMVPSVWVCLERLPKTVSGKIDRHSLRRPASADGGTTGQIRAPRDRLETRLLEIWSEVLGRSAQERPLDIDEDFSEAGGHSLLAVRLLSRIQQAFNCTLSVSDLALAGTVAAQAQLLRQRGLMAGTSGRDSDPPETVPLMVSLRQPDPGAKPVTEAPLFLIHPVGGALSCYQPLLDALPRDISVYGLRAEGLEPGETCPAESLEELAARYCQEILRQQASGPYRLCGWSFGGVVAYEIARQLRQAGEEIAFLGLVDSFTPQDLKDMGIMSGSTGADNARDCKEAFVRDLFGVEVDLATDQDVIELVRGFPQFEAVLPGAGPQDIERLLTVFSAHEKLLSAYRPQSCDVTITLVRAVEGQDRHFVESWQDLTSASVNLLNVEAGHYSVLRQPALSQWLSAFDDRPVSTRGDSTR
ncbi:amino acid adenylation domain-containing protein [Stappia sp. BW2]|uniref:non-ribosomal peptide synthetase n=1 Tax=Stappia sp. BW2 TaxID=2592622 RepID=UPI0011DEBD0F|nr:non-ribosomal peptide synthetase [Stappia sp. BW2]TYC75466.1 amino acid adenylation domain-containing protein [Stappia sp. BW2]